MAPQENFTMNYMYFFNRVKLIFFLRIQSRRRAIIMLDGNAVTFGATSPDTLLKLKYQTIAGGND